MNEVREIVSSGEVRYFPSTRFSGLMDGVVDEETCGWVKDDWPRRRRWRGERDSSRISKNSFVVVFLAKKEEEKVIPFVKIKKENQERARERKGYRSAPSFLHICRVWPKVTFCLNFVFAKKKKK